MPHPRHTHLHEQPARTQCNWNSLVKAQCPAFPNWHQMTRNNNGGDCLFHRLTCRHTPMRLPSHQRRGSRTPKNGQERRCAFPEDNVPTKSKQGDQDTRLVGITARPNPTNVARRFMQRSMPWESWEDRRANPHHATWPGPTPHD